MNVGEQPHTNNHNIECFRLACWARARLWLEGEYRKSRNPIAAAVDPLQRYAVRWGLIELIGQDAVQSIMSEAFREVRDDL